MNKAIKKLRLVWLSALGLILFFLLIKALVPSGQISYQTDFSNKSYVINQLLPTQRVEQLAIGQKIIDEPVYVSLYSPRRFNKVTVTLVFSSPPKLFNFGLAYNKALWIYDFKTAYDEAQAEKNQSLKKLPNGDYESSLEFDLTKAEWLKNKYTFMFSMPRLIESDNRLVIKSIKFDLVGDGWRQLITRLMKK